MLGAQANAADPLNAGSSDGGGAPEQPSDQGAQGAPEQTSDPGSDGDAAPTGTR